MSFNLPSNYLSLIRRRAKAQGYNPNDLHLADDGIHKAVMTDGDRNIKFGRIGYGDYELFKIMERDKQIPPGEALKHRTNYLNRSAGIKGDWASDKYSPNMLSRKILWSYNI